MQCGASNSAAASSLDALQVDELATLLLSGLEEESQGFVVGTEQADLDSAHMPGPWLEVGGVHEVEVHGALLQIDPARFQPRLVLRAAVVGHAQVSSVEVVHAGHQRLAIVENILHHGGSAAGQ